MQNGKIDKDQGLHIYGTSSLSMSSTVAYSRVNGAYLRLSNQYALSKMQVTLTNYLELLDSCALIGNTSKLICIAVKESWMLLDNT